MTGQSDKLFAELLNGMVRRHKLRARRRKYLPAAPAKAPATGGTGVCDASTPIAGS